MRALEARRLLSKHYPAEYRAYCTLAEKLRDTSINPKTKGRITKAMRDFLAKVDDTPILDDGCEGI